MFIQKYELRVNVFGFGFDAGTHRRRLGGVSTPSRSNTNGFLRLTLCVGCLQN